MRIFEEEEYEQPAVNGHSYGRDDAERTGFDAEVQEPHEYDEKGLAERVNETAGPGDLAQRIGSGDWRLFGVSRLRLVEL